MSTSQITKNAITLKGSAAIVSEYLSEFFVLYFILNSSKFLSDLDYGINSILFQRGIYPPESFSSTQQYGLTILMSKDEKIEGFIKNVLCQVEGNFSLLIYYFIYS